MSISHTQTASSADRARLFRDLHTSGRPLVLPNAWDVAGARVEVPLNVLAGPGARTVAELARLGVARVSLGSSIAEAAYAVVRRAAREVLTTGTYGPLAEAIDYGELNGLLRGSVV